MKTLYLIFSLLHDWVTIYSKYIATVLAAMVVSFFALFFIATKSATENIDSVFMESFYGGTYSVWPKSSTDSSLSEDDAFIKNCPSGSAKLDSDQMDKYLKSSLPMPFAAIGNSMEWTGVGHLTVYSVNGEDLGLGFTIISGYVAFDSTQSEYQKIYNETEDNFKYEIKDGRVYTDEELKNHEKVLVVDESSGYEVGDVLGCGKYDFEVIGVIKNEDEYSMLPFWYADECMHEYTGDRELVEGDLHVMIPTYDCYITAEQFTYAHPLTNKQLTELADILLVDKSDIHMIYSGTLERELQKYYTETYAQCAVFGVFCIINVIMVLVFLCGKLQPTMRIFRIYGAKDKTIFLITFVMITILGLAAALIGTIFSPAVFKLFTLVNSEYEFRFRCVRSAAASLIGISIIASLITSAVTVRKKMIGG